MITKEQKLKLSLLAKDLVTHSLAAPANAARQLLLDLTQTFELDLVQIAQETKIDLTQLTALGTGALDVITLSEYNRLLCFYCFRQTQATPVTFHNLTLLKPWKDLTGQPLSIHAKDELRKHGERSKVKRFYVCKKNHLYLTQRERDIALQLLKTGVTYKKIGAILGLSSRTVEFYIATIKQKFNVTSRYELKEKLKRIRNLLD